MTYRIRPDQFVIWRQRTGSISLRDRSILWRVKNPARLGQDRHGKVRSTGHFFPISKKNALIDLGPAVLEILFTENPLNELVAALRSVSTEMLSGFLSELRVLIISETDVEITDIKFIISNAPLLIAFSYQSKQGGISDETFEDLFTVLANKQIRLVDLNGCCPTKEMQLIVKYLNMKLVRFRQFPGINVETFENCRELNSAVEFVVAQGVSSNTENSGLRFLKHLKNMFPAMKQIFFDWQSMMPALTFLNDYAKACLDQLAQLYREMEMNLLGILFFMSCKESVETMEQVLNHLRAYELPNLNTWKIYRSDRGRSYPPYTLFLAGTSEKITRFVEIFCTEAIVEPDLRHFLYIQNRSINIYENEVYEFMGFNYRREESPE